MTVALETFFGNIEGAISQYGQFCKREEMLYEMLREAEYDYNMYSFKEPDQTTELRQAKAAIQCRQYEEEIQRVQAAKARALEYLQEARAKLIDLITMLEDAIPKLDQSVSTFEQMVLNPYGSNATAQLELCRAKRAEYKQYVTHAYTALEGVDSILDGDGAILRQELRRR